MVQGGHEGDAPVAVGIHEGGVGVQGQLDGHRHIPLGHGDRAAALGVVGGHHAVGADGAQSRVNGVGEVAGIGLQLQVVVEDGHVDLRRVAGNHGHGGGLAAVPQNAHLIGGVHHQDVYRGAHILPVGGDGDQAALLGGHKVAVHDLPGGGGELHLLIPDREVVPVHQVGAEGHCVARQHHRRVGGQVDVVGPVVPLDLSQQQQVVGHPPLGAVAGGVDDLGRFAVGLGGHGGGGAAAVEADGGDAAQLRHPLGQHVQGRAHAVVGLPAVDGVEDQLAVRRQAGGGAGGGLHLVVRLGHAVLHQQVHGAHRLGDAVPVGVRGEGDGGLGAGHEAPKEGQALRRTGGGGGEGHLILPEGQGGSLLSGLLQDLLHHHRQLPADGGLAVHDGAHHTDAGAGGSGGVAGVVVIGHQRHAAVFHPGLVDGRQGQPLAVPVGGGDGQIRAAHDHAAVLPEAHGVVVGGAGEDLPLRDQDAQGVAGDGVVEVAVDGAHHPVAHGLVGLGGGGGGEAVAHGHAVGRRGKDAPALIGIVGDVALPAGLVIAAAPVDVLTEGHAVVELGLPQPHLVAVGGGVGGGGGSQSQDQRQGQDQGYCSFHGISFSKYMWCLWTDPGRPRVT